MVPLSIFGVFISNLANFQQQTTVFFVAIKQLANMEIQESSVLAIVIHEKKSSDLGISEPGEK